jgi:hypothetical protein
MLETYNFSLDFLSLCTLHMQNICSAKALYLVSPIRRGISRNIIVVMMSHVPIVAYDAYAAFEVS